MEYLYGGVVIFSVGLIVFILGANRWHRSENEKIEQSKMADQERSERERIKQERLKKRRIERKKAEEDEAKRLIRQELAPHLQEFVGQHITPNIYRQTRLVKEIMEGRHITVKELLQHNVNRQFKDGTRYRVGLVKKVGSRELSLTPELIEEMQLFFYSLLDLITILKSKTLDMDNHQLLNLLIEEYEIYHNQMTAKTS